jgi:glycerophosphoryl diester phosphodiesterase
VLAHRGAGSLAPENTLAALRVGVEHGFRSVEFDARAPLDDIPVLMQTPR